MQFRIELDSNTNPVLKRQFAEYLYDRMTDDLHRLVKKYDQKYRVREKDVLSSTLIKWKGEIPPYLNLPYYVENCLILSYSSNTYVIKVNERWLVKGTLTPVKFLIRMLEYGTTTIIPFPLIRRLFTWYSNNYLNLFPEFVEERIDDIL